MNELTLPCTLTREEVILRIGVLADFHIRAMLAGLSLDEFTEVAEFPVELIPCTVNGYQRFLTETTPTIIQKTAGFILRFKAALIYELGRGVVEAIEKEHVTIGQSELGKLESTDNNNLTLWSVANPTIAELGPKARYDVITTTLFLNHVKWLVIRMESDKNVPIPASANPSEEKK